MARDWRAWHAAYDDPASSLARRLAVVVDLLGAAFDDAPPGPIRLLSLCAGDGRDVAGVARVHPRAGDLRGALVELDPHLAGAAAANLAAAGLGLEVRVGDAGDPATFADMAPVDVLLLVGIFGNIADEDVAGTIAAVPALCRAGATVLWTRHRRAPDLTPAIRRWFDEAGCASLAFRSPGEDGFAVGAERFEGATSATLPPQLFTFREDLW